METSMKTPPPLTFDGYTKEKWKKWKQKFDLYMKATGLDKKEEDRKVAVFLHVIGDEALEKYNTFGLSEADDKKLNAVIKAFEDFCSPKANETVERHVFLTRAQQSGENFTNYLTDLKTLSATCGFGNLKDSLIKDRVVCGIRDTELRNRLLREENLDLDKCIPICRAVELADMQMKTIGEDSKIHVIKRKVENHVATGSSRKQTGGGENSKTYSGNNKASGGAGRRSPSSSNQQRVCQKCGRHHGLRQCPAFGKVCNNCKRKNHFARMCKIKINSETRDEKVDSLYVGSMGSSSNELDWTEQITINNFCKIEVKLDSGARCNVMPISKLISTKLKSTKIVKTNVKLTAYGGQSISVIGKCSLNCKFSNRERADLEFIVTENTDNQPVIIGLPSLIELNIVQRVHNIKVDDNGSSIDKILNKYKKAFEGMGCITNFKYDIQLKTDAKPNIAAGRKIPIALNDLVKEELYKMEKDGIIKKVTEPTEWVHPIVISKKKEWSDQNLYRSNCA
ncbi:uncharacterized protein LOC118756529 [Rhagoletis pomonella]|uniref:uncharacterized protein LOC118756529 n=1 Tax=Rhagoletis pomonella TaxID=28610 RepID=UPI0017828F14|nr:uncharacterized protein LOC118756529 [Rhagoletis pomonella]